MGRSKKNSKGLGSLEALLIVVIVAIIGFIGWFVWHSSNVANNNLNNANDSSVAPPKIRNSDLYDNWKVSTSSRAKFSIKYPSDWKYSESVGDKDNVEHISIRGQKLVINIDSYKGNSPENGGTATTLCSDCQTTLVTKTLTLPGLGSVNLNTIDYSLDNGIGNAMILQLTNGTYFITSPKATDVRTTFRGISILDSKEAYQKETANQFTANSDYINAQKILGSVTY